MSENETAIEKRADTDLAPMMTVDGLMATAGIIQQAMKRAMRDGEHYGTIPGCGPKKTLLKPGAEKLCMLFRLAPSFAVERRDLDGGHREYEVRCTLTHIGSGSICAEGVGLCSTMESRYRWRTAERKCPACGAEAIIKGKQEFGGGYLCWKKKDGCGAKYADGDKRITSQTGGRVENPDIADVFNVVLKIAKKRAHVDAVLTATAASDIFTQDIEDLVDQPGPSHDEPPPGRRSAPTTTEAPLEDRIRGKQPMLQSPKAVASVGAEIARQAMARDKPGPYAADVDRLVSAFATIGVSRADLEAHVGHDIASVTEDEVADLRDVFAAIKSGHAKPDEHFCRPAGEVEIDVTPDELRAATRGDAPPTPEKVADPEIDALMAPTPPAGKPGAKGDAGRLEKLISTLAGRSSEPVTDAALYVLVTTWCEEHGQTISDIAGPAGEEIVEQMLADLPEDLAEVAR